MRNFRLSSRAQAEKNVLSAIPHSGPATYEEAIARIEESERDIDDNGGFAWEEVMSETRD